MGRVVHFEIAAEDPDRAAEFYRKAFNWEISDWGGPMKYMLATTGPADSPGINGAITSRSDRTQAVINTIEVANWEMGARAVAEAGGKVLSEKTAIPGVGWLAYCVDTEGNVFAMLESDPAAQAAGIPAAAGQTTR